MAKGKRRGHGEGSVYQRASDGKWVGTLDLGYMAGKRKRKVIYGDTQKDVQTRLRKLQLQQSQGINVAPERETVEAFLRRWVRDVVALRASARTVEMYEGVITRYIAPVLGRTQVTRLTRQDVQAFVSDLDASGLAPTTIRLIWGCLRSGLKQAVAWDIVLRNVATGVTLPRFRPSVAQALDVQQSITLIDALHGDPYEPLILTALVLGLRRGEVLGLQWQDIDFTQQTLRVARAVVVGVGRKIEIVDTKTRSSRRVLPVPGFLADALSRHEYLQREQRALWGEAWNPMGLVFPAADGGLERPTNINKVFSAVLRRAGLPHIRFHDLRHSCASLLAALGVHPRVAMDILGHSTIAITQQLYTHVFDESRRDVGILLEGLLGERRKKD